MPFKRIEVNGREYFRQVNIDWPETHMCPIGYISGDGIPEDENKKEGKNLWTEWKRD